jgi:hypothetical protein
MHCASSSCDMKLAICACDRYVMQDDVLLGILTVGCCAALLLLPLLISHPSVIRRLQPAVQQTPFTYLCVACVGAGDI